MAAGAGLTERLGGVRPAPIGAAAVGQPLMGGSVDQFGARRLFVTATTVALLRFVLSFAHPPRWRLPPVFVVAVVTLVIWERAVRSPFLDVRGLVLATVVIQLLDTAVIAISVVVRRRTLEATG